MIIFALWGFALVVAWLAGAYTGQPYSWIPLVTGLLFVWAWVTWHAGFARTGKGYLVAGVLLGSVFVGLQAGLGAALEWLLYTAIFLAAGAAILFYLSVEYYRAAIPMTRSPHARRKTTSPPKMYRLG